MRLGVGMEAKHRGIGALSIKTALRKSMVFLTCIGNR